jgi:hypothetical protein
MPSMQYDVLASKPLTSTGQFKDQNNNNLARVRIKSFYGVANTAGSVVFYDGTANTDPVLMTVNAPAKADSGTFWLPMPGEGILAENAVYAEITGPSSIMIIYG